MFKKNKKNGSWDFSDNVVFKSDLLKKMKNLYTTELTDDEIANVVGGASDGIQKTLEEKCLYWENKSGDYFAGCANCTNQGCAGVFNEN